MVGRMEKQECGLCKEKKTESIRLKGTSICESCEKSLVRSRVEDEDYERWKDAIKGILFDVRNKHDRSGENAHCRDADSL